MKSEVNEEVPCTCILYNGHKGGNPPVAREIMIK